MKKLICALTLCSALCVQACDFTLTNDGSCPMVVIDPNNSQTLLLMPGMSGNINPSIPGIRRFQNIVPDIGPLAYLRYPETLDIYITQPGTASSRHYRIVERYCSADPNEYRLSEIVGFVANPHPRLRVQKFEPYQPAEHANADGGHSH